MAGSYVFLVTIQKEGMEGQGVQGTPTFSSKFILLIFIIFSLHTKHNDVPRVWGGASNGTRPCYALMAGGRMVWEDYDRMDGMGWDGYDGYDRIGWIR